jgi:hypothetical protein
MLLVELASLENLNALASSLAVGVGDVRGCLILSRDGLVLGSHPAEADKHVTDAWLRFAFIGEPERAFAQFGPETWCYVRRGPYAAFAVVGPGARPGLAIDQMDQVLLAAEDARARRENVRVSEHPAGAASSKPRSPLHPDHRSEEPLVIPSAPVPIAVEAITADSTEQAQHDDARADAPNPEPEPGPEREVDGPYLEAETEQDADADGGEEEPALEALGELANEGIWGSPEDDEVDRFSLAREFGQLLQRDDDGADG